MLDLIQSLIDLIFRVLPQKRPSPQQALKAKVIAHRGAHKYGVKENTLKGFERCIEQGIWGIEFDIRWTKDGEPVLIHNKNAAHVYHRPDIIPNQLTLSKLKQEIPEIPTLEEVVYKFGGKIHFMIELKAGFSDKIEQIKRLLEILAPLRPLEDFHLLSLSPLELLSIEKITKKAMIGISLVNTKRIAKVVTTNAMGGHCGYFLLLSNRIREQHKLSNIKTGTGYIASRNSLYREINRNVDWIFTNKPFEMQLLLEEMKRQEK